MLHAAGASVGLVPRPPRCSPPGRQPLPRGRIHLPYTGYTMHLRTLDTPYTCVHSILHTLTLDTYLTLAVHSIHLPCRWCSSRSSWCAARPCAAFVASFSACARCLSLPSASLSLPSASCASPSWPCPSLPCTCPSLFAFACPTLSWAQWSGASRDEWSVRRRA